LNGHTTIADGKNFDSGSGTGVTTLRGDTTISSPKTFQVGGQSVFYEQVTIGQVNSNGAKTLQLYGDFHQSDDNTPRVSTFTTGTGAITMLGDISVGSGKFFKMDSTGSGEFVTGQGGVSLNGDTTIASAKTFQTGTGASVTINGPTQIAANTGYTFNVGDDVTGFGGIKFHGATTVGAYQDGLSRDFTVYGNVVFANDKDGTVKDFTTANDGSINFNGDLSLNTGKSITFAAAGAGNLVTSNNGHVALNGDTTVAQNKRFDLGTSTSIQCLSDVTTGSATYCLSAR